jgi:hypothetical protein
MTITVLDCQIKHYSGPSQTYDDISQNIKRNMALLQINKNRINFELVTDYSEFRRATFVVDLR